MATTFTLKIAAIDTPTSAFEALKNQASSISSSIFSNSEFKKEFKLSNPFTDGFGNSMSGGFDSNGNILLKFSKTLSDGSGSNKTLNATFFGKDVSSMFNTDLDFSLKPDFSLTTTDSLGSQKTSTVKIYQGDKLSQLSQSDITADNAKYFDSKGNEFSASDATLTIEDDGNIFAIIRTDLKTTLKDGTTATLNTIIDTIDSATNHLKTFASSSFNYLVKPFQDNANLAYMATSIVAELVRGGDLDDVIKRIALQEYVAKPITNMGVSYLTSQLNLNLTQSETSTLLDFSNGTIDQLPDDLTTKLLETEALNAGVQALVSFAITAIINGKDMGSEDYLLAAANIGVSQAIGWGVNALAGTTVANATSQVAAQAVLLMLPSPQLPPLHQELP